MIGLQMDRNRQSFRIISALLFICLSIETSIVSAKPFTANRTEGFTPAKQSPRTITIGSRALHAFNQRNDKNSNFSRKKSPKSDVTSDTDTYQEEDSDSNSGDPRESEWSLQFDPNYFALLNAANHRPIDAMIASSTDSQTKHSMTPSSPSSSSSFSPSSSSSTSSGSPSPENTYYYSPETYGKTSHKNHKTGSFAYLYPSSSTTTTSTTTSTTPTPKTSHNRFGELSGGSSSNSYSEPAPLYPSNYNSNDKHQSSNYNDDESPEGEEEEASYYDTNEEIGRKYYYPTRNRPKQYPVHSAQDYYGSDLSSMPSSHEKVKSAMNSPVASYGTQEETDVGHNVATYESGGKVMFPSRPYRGGLGSGAYYPSPSTYYPHPYYSSAASETSSFGGAESLLHKSSSWLGPGIAGLLLGILPLGLLMASMVPTIMSVPIVSTATVGRKKRFVPDFGLLNFNDTNIFLNSGVIDIIGRYGMTSLEDPNCLMEMLCTFAAEGKKSNKNLVQNLFYHIIDWLVKQTILNLSV